MFIQVPEAGWNKNVFSVFMLNSWIPALALSAEWVLFSDTWHSWPRLSEACFTSDSSEMTRSGVESQILFEDLVRYSIISFEILQTAVIP